MTEAKSDEDLLQVDNRHDRNEGDEGKEYSVGIVRKSPPSVYVVNYRSVYEDTYPAKFDDELAEMLIKLYSDEGDLLIDPCGGSGVIPLKAIELNRDAVYQDVNPTAHDIMAQKLNEIVQRMKLHGELFSAIRDSKKTIFSPPGRKAQLILFSPPFGLEISGAYEGKGAGPSGYSNELEDIANCETYEGWRLGLRAIMKNCFEILEANRLMIVEIRPRSKKGHAYPLEHWIWQDAIEIGFEFFFTMIEVTQPWRMWTYRDKESQMVKPIPYHAYLLMFKKPGNDRLL